MPLFTVSEWRRHLLMISVSVKYFQMSQVRSIVCVSFSVKKSCRSFFALNSLWHLPYPTLNVGYLSGRSINAPQPWIAQLKNKIQFKILIIIKLSLSLRWLLRFFIITFPGIRSFFLHPPPTPPAWWTCCGKKDGTTCGVAINIYATKLCPV